jgi:hypothetical protein
MMVRSLVVTAILLAIPFSACAEEDASIGLDSIVVSPMTIQLTGKNRQQQMLITGLASSGKASDITRRVQFQIADTAIAGVAGSMVMGLSDGETELIVRLEGRETRVPLIVTGSSTIPPVHFINDIVPLFSKLRCNSSGCHGKQSGQNGFKLSVFGFDPVADFNALVKEGRGRRLFPAEPARSLLYLKATGLSPHGGGRRVEPDSVDAELIRQWIAQGTPWGQADAPHVVALHIEPAERAMRMSATQQILATAVYSDGQKRDVTQAATYSTNADHVAEVDNLGQIMVGDTPGEAAITINYMGQVGVSRVFVPRATLGFTFERPPANNQIDDLVWSKLERLGLSASELCDDATFLRRLYLDAIGTLPRPTEVQRFLADPNPDKRREVIDRVLDREEFADYWALKWSDVLLVNSSNLGERGAYVFHRWLRAQIVANRPYDQWVRELLTASGNSGKVGPTNFYRAMRTPTDLTKTVSQAFLGIRMDCAQCHHHPFEKWGQEDFYGLAGFFNGIEFKKLSPDRELVFHGGHKPAKMPITGESVPTRTLDGEPIDLDDLDPRVHLADWIVSPDNPWFARLAANRIWKHYMGRGLVEPEDDLRSTNPATNEPLLTFLTAQVVEDKFDLKAVMRLILNSRVYQLSSTPNDANRDDVQNFSHHLIKRLPAEVLLDAISEVTASPDRFAGAPRGTRSIQLWDNQLPSYFLDAFGRSPRESPCECAKSNAPTMAQALHLMNAPEIEAKIVDPAGRVATMVAQNTPTDALVDQLCLAAIGRLPDEEQRAVATMLFAGQPVRQAAEDFVWTLLNSYEFLFIQ